MRPNYQLPSYVCLGIAETLIIILTIALYLPVAFATARDKAPRTRTAAAPVAGTIRVNVSGDGDNLDPNSGCDTDPATPGEQCSLRAAIQRTNALAGDDEQNTGGATASNVKLTTGTLSSPTVNGAPLPRTFGNLAPGQWATTVVIFAGANNSPGAKKTLTFAGSYTGGTFSDKWKVSLP